MHPIPPITVVAQGQGARPRWVVIDKPPGLLSVPGKDPDLPNAQAWCRGAFAHAQGPITVHRLDMHTSGLLLLALDAEAHRALSAQFARREVEKTYTALVHGTPPHVEGTIDLPMRADITRRPLQIIDHTLGKPAQTTYRVQAHNAGTTRVELVPHTGRSHQLRLHMATIACPIVGDALYGPPGDPSPRLMLHATSLMFTDPDTGDRITCTAEPAF